MKAVIQRVKYAKVTVDKKIIGQINYGMVVLLGVTHSDTEVDVQWLSKKILGLRIFNDTEERMNLSLSDINGELLIISQFTLYGNCEKGRRPSFTEASKPDMALNLYNKFLKLCKNSNLKIAHGEFGADMQVELLNDGPVTLIIDTKYLLNKK